MDVLQPGPTLLFQAAVLNYNVNRHTIVHNELIIPSIMCIMSLVININVPLRSLLDFFIRSFVHVRM